MKPIYFTITGTNHYYGSDFMKLGMQVRLIKDIHNEFDNEAIVSIPLTEVHPVR